MKFRIWDKLEKKMIYPDTFEAESFYLNLSGRIWSAKMGYWSSDYIILQFLGNYPKLGDVYHGDIIKVENLSEWWDVEPLPEKHKYHHVVVTDTKAYNYAFHFKNAVEKVGNVFENPEIVDRIRERYSMITAGRRINEDLLSLTWD